MQMPPDSSSSESLLGFGDFHLAALGADSRTADIGRDFLEIQNALRTALDARRSAERAELGAEAIRTGIEVEAEADIRRLDLSLLSVVNKKRERDPYKRVFTHGLKAALMPKGKAQALEAIRIVEVVAPSPGAAPLAGVPDEAVRIGAELRAKCARLDTAVDAEDAAARATALALANEHQARRRWREQYRKNHGLLLALFPTDLRKVESFFKKATKKKGGGGATEPVTPS